MLLSEGNFKEIERRRKESRDIREGIKLRNIVHSIRINEVSPRKIVAGVVGMNRCIIQRKLHVKDLILGQAQWGVFTRNGQRDECWICG